ncbi:DUF1801 domain-containing protein [Candidatus Saccharibacteria bacterium]|nr:DUF1801 domain-containing protein [Candidatus Saccharibacteria bacterium]
MSSTIKTLVNDASVEAFINSVENETRRQGGHTLLEMYTRIIGEPARMWGSAIVGFGQYHYKSERSRQEGDWPLSAFSPRKQNLTLYITFGFDGQEALLEKLGKHTTSKGCLYINKLADVDVAVLEKIVKASHEKAVRELT